MHLSDRIIIKSVLFNAIRAKRVKNYTVLTSSVLLLDLFIYLLSDNVSSKNIRDYPKN